MKHSKLFLTGMAALLLSFGLLMTGCDSGGGDDDPPPPKPDTSVTYRSTTDGTATPASHTFILEVFNTPSPGASIRAYTPAQNDTFVLYAGPTGSFGEDYEKVEGTVGAPVTTDGVTTLTLTTDAADTITATISAAGGLTSLNGSIGTVTIVAATTLTPVLPLPALTGATIGITGTEKSGSTLTATVTATVPTDAAGGLKSYQWLRDGEPIEDADALAYNLTADDEGAKLKLRLTVLGYTGHVDSDETGTIGAGFKLPAATYTVVAQNTDVTDATKVHYGASQVLTYFITTSTTETLLQDTSLDKVLSGLLTGDTFTVDTNGLITAVTFSTGAHTAGNINSVLGGVANSGTVTLGANTTLGGNLTVPANKTLDAKGFTLGTSGTETVTVNGTLISGTGATKRATLKDGVVITAGAAEANLAADGVVTVLGVDSTIDLDSGASIKVEGDNGSLVVGTGGATTTFVKATVTANADAALTAAASTGAVNIGGTTVLLGNAGSITTLSTAALSAGDGSTNNTALALVTVTAPTAGDTVTATAAGVLTIPASGIAFSGIGTATVIGDGALVTGGTNKVTLTNATYTADAGTTFVAAASPGVITMAVDDTLVLAANGKIDIKGTGKVVVGLTEFTGVGAWTASGAAVTVTGATTGAALSGSSATLTASGLPVITQKKGTGNALGIGAGVTLALGGTIASGAAGTTVGSIVLEESTTAGEGGKISFPATGTTAIILCAAGDTAGAALGSAGGVFVVAASAAAGKISVSAWANVNVHPGSSAANRLFKITGGTSAGTISAYGGLGGSATVTINAAIAAGT